MKVACLLVLLCVAVVYEAEAGWWRKATSWVGSAVGTVVGMVGKKNRRRRSLEDETDQETMTKVKKMCTEKHLSDLTPDGVPFEVVKSIFETVNKKGIDNDALDEGELDAFVNALDVFKYCMTKGDKAKAP